MHTVSYKVRQLGNLRYEFLMGERWAPANSFNLVCGQSLVWVVSTVTTCTTNYNHRS